MLILKMVQKQATSSVWEAGHLEALSLRILLRLWVELLSS